MLMMDRRSRIGKRMDGISFIRKARAEERKQDFTLYTILCETHLSSKEGREKRR
jgi:hypothetical protein